MHRPGGGLIMRESAAGAAAFGGLVPKNGTVTEVPTQLFEEEENL